MKRDPALRSLIASAATAFRLQVDVDAIAGAPRSFAAAARKLGPSRGGGGESRRGSRSPAFD